MSPRNIPQKHSRKVLYKTVNTNDQVKYDKMYLKAPLISAAPLGIHIEISASPLISAALLKTALIRIATIFY